MSDAPAQPLKAAAWMSGAVVAFSAMAVAGRGVSAELDTFETMMYRSLVGVLVIGPIVLASGKTHILRTRHLGLHMLRNSFHFAGQNLWFWALTMIPLAPLFALEFTAPLWVMILSPLLLGERLSARRLGYALLGFAGILIVARPDPGNLSPGMLAAAAAALCFAGTAIATKRLTRSEPVLAILFWLTVMQLLLGVVSAGWDGDIAVPSAGILPWVVTIGLGGLVAHTSLTTALRLAPASIVMPVDFVRLPVIALIGMILYHEPLDPLVFVGAVLIFSANYLNVRHDGDKKATPAQ